jgi:hypothetical protein
MTLACSQGLLESLTDFLPGVIDGYYSGTEEHHVGQAFEPDRAMPSGWKA